MKDVQIPLEMFVNLINYFFPDNIKDCPVGHNADIIRQQIRDKMQKMINRELFTRYKTAKTPLEREKARREYLEQRGISQAFISDTEQHYENI